jgi:hypothetical protein
MMHKHKNKLFLLILPLFFLEGCATSPEGKNILMDQIKNERHSREKTSETIKQGRPIFVKAYSYPQLLNDGDIWGGGTVFVEVGREKLDINKVVLGEK